MLPLMSPHVDPLGGYPGGPVGRLTNSLRLTHKRHDAPVVILVRFDAEEFHARNVPDAFRQGVDGLLVFSFAEVRNTFNDSFHAEVPDFICAFVEKDENRSQKQETTSLRALFAKQSIPSWLSRAVQIASSQLRNRIPSRHLLSQLL